MKTYFFLLCSLCAVPGIFPLLQMYGHKYYLVKTNVTWQVAQNYCRETYDDLATVETDLDWFGLNKVLVAQGLKGAVQWVGLYNDVNSWRWSFLNVPLKSTFVHWNTGQPNNAGGDETCVLMGKEGYWWDYTCSLLYPFICFNANMSTSGRYIGVSTLMSWSDAQAYCRTFHTDLALANSAAENNLMVNVGSAMGKSWIGLYRDSWKWSDGTNTSSLMWHPGKPDNYYSNENCGVLDNGWFVDSHCNKLQYFICHTAHLLRKQQIVKLKIKSDESMTDAVMQSDISDLIKEKLDENGMLENTTVDWRVPSDGHVFHEKKGNMEF